MNFIKHVENIEHLIISTVDNMLLDQNLKTHNHTIFHNIQVIDHSILYKQFKDVNVWLISDFNKTLYNQTIDDYLKSNLSDHGKQVYTSYLKNKDFFENEYFGQEQKIIENKTGILFTKLEQDKETGQFVKRSYFIEYNFNLD